MAAEIGLQKISQLLKPGLWSLNGGGGNGHRHTSAEDDNSWEVRAFAEDTGSTMGTNMAARSYTCSFCRHEFRSSQALGGHMNVHRHDRARLRGLSSSSSLGLKPYPSISGASPFTFPYQPDPDAGGGLCLFYPTQAATREISFPLFSMRSCNYGGNVALNLLSGMAGGKGNAKDESYGMVVDETDLELRLGW